MNSNFITCVRFLYTRLPDGKIVGDEGGNSDDPADSGGRTSRGITQREYTAWCHLHGSPDGDVFLATDATIDAIYRLQYWQPNCDPMPKGTDYLLFDMNVNMGPVQGARLLQRALKVTDDGHIGVVTMQAAMTADPKILIPLVTEQKTLFYKELEREQPKDVVFDHGWMNRVANVQARATGML